YLSGLSVTRAWEARMENLVLSNTGDGSMHGTSSITTSWTFSLFASRIGRLVICFAALSWTDIQSIQACTPERPGLISRWSPETYSGTTVADFKEVNPGQVKGGITIERNQTLPHFPNPSSVFHFDGTGFITILHPRSLQFDTRPFSLEIRFLWDG